MKKLFALHSWLGLISGLILLTASVTGSLLVFHHELDELSLPPAARIRQDPAYLSLDKAIASVRAAYPDRRLRIYTTPLSRTHPIVFDVRKSGEAKRMVYVHPASGNILWDVDRDKITSRWLLKLHYTLFAGRTGNVLMALFGFCLLGLLITGVIIYRKHVLKVLSFREKFNTKNWRTSLSSLHRFVGVWALFFNGVVVMTGLFLQINIVLASLKPTTPTPRQAIVKASVDEMFVRLKAELPAFRLMFFRLPQKTGQPVVFYGKAADEPALFAPYASTVSFDAQNGKLLTVKLISDQPLKEQLLAVITPLHFGGFAGYASKLVYSFFGLSTALLSISGFFLWMKRKKFIPRRRVKVNA